MRILYIVHQFMPEFATGTETVALNMAKAAQRSGHHVAVLTCALGDRSNWPITLGGLWSTSVKGVPVYAFPFDLVSDEFGLRGGDSRQIEELVRRFPVSQRYDVVHVMHTLRMLPAIKAVRELSLPYVMTLTDFFPLCCRINLVRVSGDLCDGPREGRSCARHCHIEENVRRRQALFGDILAHARERVACSGFVQRQYNREFSNLSFRVLPHGIDCLRFSSAVRRKSSDAFTFGFLGTMSAIKGANMLAKAFAAADIESARLKMVGPVHGNDKIVAGILDLAAKNNRLILHDAVPADEVPNVLSEFDVLCLPSQVPETFSLSLHQGFAAGLPALVSDLGNPAEVISNIGCGRVIAANDSEAWCAAMREVASDPSIASQWRTKIPMPMRIEEEAFFYEHIYRHSLSGHYQRKAS